MRVRDIMTERPQTLAPAATVFDALTLMADLEIRHVPIVDGDQLLGTISDRDLRPYARASLDEGTEARERLRVRLSDVMSADVVSIDDEADIDDVIELLVEHKIGAVPVVNADDVLVGIVSVIDVLRAAQGRLT
jgi:CBS domain-containing protein